MIEYDPDVISSAYEKCSPAVRKVFDLLKETDNLSEIARRLKLSRQNVHFKRDRIRWQVMQSAKFKEALDCIPK